MNTEQIKTILKDLSREHGFVDSGIIVPKRPAHYDVYLSWLSDGHAAGMSYLGTERSLTCREDPVRLFPECKSILVVLARYPSPVKRNSEPEDINQGRVAAYAWGEDYHSVLVKKLNQLSSKFQELTGLNVRSQPVTDNVPLLEREMAQEAGLGWVGRNSCLISPKYGSFTFIAEILMDIPIEPDDTLITDHCGTCQRCVNACPTHCIQPNRTIQAERCISFLTIENRGDIPAELRPLMVDWIFGCDICQLVCPWNQKTNEITVDGLFNLRAHLAKLDLVTELDLSEDEFKAVYCNSPILRSKRNGYIRNIAIVLGNQRNRNAIIQLKHTKKNDPAPIVREAAGWALDKICAE